MDVALRVGFAANVAHHQSVLRDCLSACEQGVRELGVQLRVVGRTYDAIAEAGLLQGYDGLHKYPYGRDGGLMRLVAEVVGLGPDRTLDGVIYLIDPVDPSSIFPEALALKRQCVIHGKPFVSTMAGLRDWLEMERVTRGLAPDAQVDDLHQFEAQTLALIAHDALKPQMLAFVERNFALLSRFGQRVGTGTTGQQLNELARRLGWQGPGDWIQRFQSGPLGGDAQIADLVLQGRCQRVIFFEDPHVARQHEADIQLLERAVTTRTRSVVCTTSPPVAQRWCDAAQARARARGASH
ncbi:methylglyoxal synthase [Lampropedia cohaerens]|uniref:Methylglyoxal synthase n=1 Tax=Lampropedia cohaerens TaxID=1610491 RepID=A0A0U1PX66_9BURK|nr:hypothetical protein [Lampropedia cohaerens]KKW67071.1 methylglyoxal synthase [Lampropedia cohaerens]